MPQKCSGVEVSQKGNTQRKVNVPQNWPVKLSIRYWEVNFQMCQYLLIVYTLSAKLKIV